MVGAFCKPHLQMAHACSRETKLLAIAWGEPWVPCPSPGIAPLPIRRGFVQVASPQRSRKVLIPRRRVLLYFSSLPAVSMCVGGDSLRRAECSAVTHLRALAPTIACGPPVPTLMRAGGGVVSC